MASSAQHKDAPHRSKESVMAATSKGEIRFLLRGRSCPEETAKISFNSLLFLFFYSQDCF